MKSFKAALLSTAMVATGAVASYAADPTSPVPATATARLFPHPDSRTQSRAQQLTLGRSAVGGWLPLGYEWAR